MKKGLFKIIIICLSMIIMITSLNYFSEDKVILKDISGDRSELEDISILYDKENSLDYNQFSQPYYEQSISENYISIKGMMLKGIIGKNMLDISSTFSKGKGSIISKNGIEDVNLQETSYDSYLINDKGYKSKLLKSRDPRRDLLEDENYLWDTYITNDVENIESLYIYLEQINKKNNQVDVIKIPLKKDLYKPEGDYIDVIDSFIYKDKIYMIVRKSYSSEHEQRPDKNYILEVDVNLKNYKIVKEIEYNNYFYGFKFINKDKIYLEAEKHIENEYSYSYFLIYDISKNELYESNKFMSSKSEDGYSLHQEIIGYYIEDNSLNVLIKDKENYVLKNRYSLENLEIIDEQKYDFQINYSPSSYDSEAIKKIAYSDGKIITLYQRNFISRRKDKNKKEYLIKGNKPIDIKVFDTNKNKMVYEGEIISSNENTENKLNIVKEY